MNVTEAIVTALISAAAAIAVCILNSNINNRRLLSQLEKQDELQAYRIEQLEGKVDRHNRMVERTYKLEREYATHNEKLKAIDRRVEELEEAHR